MSGAFQPGLVVTGGGRLLAQWCRGNYFRDVIYNQSAASDTVVPWDVVQSQPALATVREIFKGSVLDVGTGICCPPPLPEFTLVPPTIGINSANSVTYGVNSDRDGGQRALDVHTA
jgi:hypothetical protein